MARVVAVSGGKGGVGKTTTVSNLGTALMNLGKDVIVIDGNLSTPNLSLHLGIPLYPITLHDVLKGDAYVTEAMYIHPSGLRVIPGGISIDDLKGANAKKFHNVVKQLHGSADLILLDCAAGLGSEMVNVLRNAHDLIIVTNPDMPAVTDALKLKKIADELGINTVGVVLNRVSARRVQLTDREVKQMLDLPIIARIPEDPAIPESIHMKTPAVHHKPRSPASRAFKKLASDLVGQPRHMREVHKEGFFEWIRRAFFG